MTFRMTAIMSSDISGLLTNLERACRLVGVSASRACRLAEHWDRRSSGSDCGKKTLDGMPLAAGSKLIKYKELIRSGAQRYVQFLTEIQRP